MTRQVAVGLGRDGEPVYLNMDFLDGTRGAHVSISGVSGVATKTSFALFLLHSIGSNGAPAQPDPWIEKYIFPNSMIPAASQVTAALTPFAHAAHVTSVASPYQAPGQISRGGHIAFARIQFGVPGPQISNGEALALMHDARAASGHGVTFSLGGDVVDLAETPYGGPTEGVGVLAAAIVLLIAFGSLLAMGLPILTALLGIGAGMSVIALLGHLAPAPSFSPIIAAMIGLGVGVDYALFIVTRFREALRAGRAPIRRTWRGETREGVVCAAPSDIVIEEGEIL